MIGAHPFALQSCRNTGDGVDCPAAVQPQDDENPLVDACAGSVDGPNAESFSFHPSSVVLQVGAGELLFSS